MTILTLAITAILIMAGGVAPGPVREVRKEAAPRPTIVHEMIVEPTYNGNGEMVATGAVPDLDTLRHDYIADFAVEQEAARVQAKRQRIIDTLNRYLGGSPMAGLGVVMVTEAERTNCSPYLCAVQAMAESSLGRVNLYPYQAWGMYGVHPSSWEDGVRRYYDNLVLHWGSVWDAHQLVNPDYCEPPEPYNSNVQGIVNALGVEAGFGGGGSSAE